MLKFVITCANCRTASLCSRFVNVMQDPIKASYALLFSIDVKRSCKIARRPMQILLIT